MKSLGSRQNQHSFARTPEINIQRSVFNRSFQAKDTMNFDLLTPFFWDEILPGDTAKLNVQMFARLATQVVPLMDNMYMDFFFFFIPNRIVWKNFTKFMGEQENPDDSIDYLIPQVHIPAPTGLNTLNMTIYDKLGLPIAWPSLEDMKVNSLLLRGYNLTYNYWFRDQNLQNSLFVPTDDGPDNFNDFNLVYSGKKHDYFTSALKTPQKGAAVTFPIGGTAPITGSITQPNGVLGNFAIGSNYTEIQAGANSTTGATQFATTPATTIGTPINWLLPSGALNSALSIAGLSADLASATATTINQFRQAMFMQEFLERDNRGGTRYKEVVMSHFNVLVPDFRVQWPEHLGNATIRINQHVIAQTSETGSTPQGNLAAFSTASASGQHVGFNKSFTEHGFVLGLCRARADITYQYGLNRSWFRRTRYDLFWPEFQQLGDQIIANKEIFYRGSPLDDQAFGYIERHGDYRFRPSEVRGFFRSNAPQTLDVWHLAQEMTLPPVLNAQFIQSNTPIERSLAVTEGYPDLLVDYWFDYQHARPMVAYPVPASLGRF